MPLIELAHMGALDVGGFTRVRLWWTNTVLLDFFGNFRRHIYHIARSNECYKFIVLLYSTSTYGVHHASSLVLAGNAA